MTNAVSITNTYSFCALSTEQVQALEEGLKSLAKANEVRGLFIIGPEGVNGTLSGSPEGVSAFKDFLKEFLNRPALEFKDSTASEHPFLNFKVKIRDEIVTLGRPDLFAHDPEFHAVEPKEWDALLENPDNIVIDTRNDYEVELGKFRGALDFKMSEFTEFPAKLREAQIPKEKTVLIYCTGGIRCEKAILEMQEQGYQNVKQLRGGILTYLKERPDQNFEGECFVFDSRVAVTQQLAPAPKYEFCPHCGSPARETIHCADCDKDGIICKHCVDSGITTCSKNCRYHQGRKANLKGLRVPL